MIVLIAWRVDRLEGLGLLDRHWDWITLDRLNISHNRILLHFPSYIPLDATILSQLILDLISAPRRNPSRRMREHTCQCHIGDSTWDSSNALKDYDSIFTN